MKLRNKETGKVQTCDMVVITDEKIDGGIASLNKHTFIFRSIEQFNDEYEAYKPKEPLIKDEKIRKAVRAWAEVNLIKNVLYAERSDRSLYALTDMGDDDFSIELVGWIPTLKDGGEYTIAELCGPSDSEEEK